MKEFPVYLQKGGEHPEHTADPRAASADVQAMGGWMKNLAAQGKLADRGYRLHPDGKTVKPGDVVMDGPFAEIKKWLEVIR